MMDGEVGEKCWRQSSGRLCCGVLYCWLTLLVVSVGGIVLFLLATAAGSQQSRYNSSRSSSSMRYLQRSHFRNS